MKKKKILFIINQKSGVKKRVDFPLLVNTYIDKNNIDHDTTFTKAPKHATQLSREAALNGYDTVIAIGGDGSANEVAKGLMGFETAMGIIPTGSGNGMARHMQIPMDYRKAINIINTGKVERIDTFQVNDEFCLGTLGVGFDAYIAHRFAQSPKRGYSTYAKLVLTEFHKYKPLSYQMTIDGKEFTKRCFLLTFANSSQFGNNARIAPFASVKDGILDISMLEKFPLYQVPWLLYKLMNNAIHHSRFFEMKTAKEVMVKNNQELPGHIDGEPVTFSSNLHIKIVPLSLNVIVPN